MIALIKKMHEFTYAILTRQKLLLLRYKFRFHSSPNTKNFDKKIKKIADDYLSAENLQILEKGISINADCLGIFSTTIDASGGHTEYIKNILYSLPQNMPKKLFLTKKSLSFENAQKNINEIGNFAKISGVDWNYKKEKEKFNELLSEIISFAPKAVIVCIFPNDTFAAAICSILKQKTNIKILFFDHASHYISLGMSFSHLILQGMPSTAFISQKLRGFRHTRINGICYLPKNKLPIFTDEQIQEMKKKINLPSDALCAMSGAASYKFFENGGGSSRYLEMIKNLLEKHENLHHILITKFNANQEKIFNSIFENSNARERIILLDFTPNYKLLFKCADVFIDSFPISSALTMIDLMSLGVPFVAKLNRDNLAFSFHEYLVDNYKYIYDNAKDMEIGVEKLLFSESGEYERKEIIKNNYEHFFNVFDGEKYASDILELINCKDISKAYSEEISADRYKDFKEIKLLRFI